MQQVRRPIIKLQAADWLGAGSQTCAAALEELKVGHVMIGRCSQW